jgi:hypothetical protein
MTHATAPRRQRADSVAGKGPILVAIAATATLAVGLAQTSVGHFLLQEAGLREPTGYTSLAFTDPQSLPTQISSVPARVSVSFVVNNTSADPRSYHWSIVLDRAGRTYRLAAGEVGVPSGDRATVARTVTASCAKGQARMTVQVAAPAESIDFWMTCSPRKAAKR